MNRFKVAAHPTIPWYLLYEQISPSTIYIVQHSHYRSWVGAVGDGSSHFHLEENADRIVTGAMIDGTKYDVINPHHVFDYTLDRHLTERDYEELDKARDLVEGVLRQVKPAK